MFSTLNVFNRESNGNIKPKIGQLIKAQILFFQNFRTASDRVLTFEVDYVMANENDRASLSVYDGSYFTNTLLMNIPIRNDTKPQSVVTTGNSMFVAFKAKPFTNALIYIRITAGLTKKYDINITGSSIVDNNGRGLAVENLKSSVYINQASISNNKHIAGMIFLWRKIGFIINDYAVVAAILFIRTSGPDFDKKKILKLAFVVIK